MYSMSILMDFKVASDTDIGILKSIVGITKKIKINLRGDNTIAVGLLESNTFDVGILGDNTIDVGVPIPEVNVLPQVLHANAVGVVGVTQTGKACDKGEKCAKVVMMVIALITYVIAPRVVSLVTILYKLCIGLQHMGKQFHFSSSNNFQSGVCTIP